MIVLIDKVVTFKDQFEIKKTSDGFLLSIQNDNMVKAIHVSTEELELIRKAIDEELKAGK